MKYYPSVHIGFMYKQIYKLLNISHFKVTLFTKYEMKKFFMKQNKQNYLKQNQRTFFNFLMYINRLFTTPTPVDIKRLGNKYYFNNKINSFCSPYFSLIIGPFYLT